MKLIDNDLHAHIMAKGGIHVTSGTATGNFAAAFVTSSSSGTIAIVGCPGLTGTLTAVKMVAGTYFIFPQGTVSVTPTNCELILYYA